MQAHSPNGANSNIPGDVFFLNNQQSCHAGHISSHVINHHWAKIVLVLETTCEQLVRLTWAQILMVLRGKQTVSILTFHK